MRKDLTKRKQQTLSSRQLIFDTANTLFKKKGYDRTTVGDICGKAGILTGAFYHQFKSKDQVIAEEYLKIDAFYQETFDNLPAGLSAGKVVAQYLLRQRKRYGALALRQI